jgi:hypothetical protein
MPAWWEAARRSTRRPNPVAIERCSRKCRRCCTPISFIHR